MAEREFMVWRTYKVRDTAIVMAANKKEAIEKAKCCTDVLGESLTHGTFKAFDVERGELEYATK